MRKIIRWMVTNAFTWSILNFLYRIIYRFKFEKDLIPIEKKKQLLAEKEEVLKKKFSHLTVQYGPFKGMKYPGFIAMGSALYPKLHGSYECELDSTIEELLKSDYTEILDVGCAEGYYAVGLAMRKPNVKVYAFDVNSEAINACKKMAAINKVEDRMTFGNFCSPETLASFKFSGRALLICDCEGYEKELFNSVSVKNLKNCDVLIEMHDLYDERITPSVEKAFSLTHSIKYIYSENTFTKLDRCGLRGDLSEDQVLNFFTERNGIMTWALVQPK
jgi:hypothetical protein